MKALTIGLAGLLVGTAWLASRASASVASAGGDGGEQSSGWLATAEDVLISAADSVARIMPVSWGLDMWHESKIPAQYLAMIRAAEAVNGLPRNMLARLLWQESRYREDIITGRVTSSVGAQGIAQFMHATAEEFGIDPLDPAQAIPAAGRYLRQLYSSLGSWSKALAAYNWGIGNVRRKGLDKAPAETRAYYGGILADIGMAAV